MTDPAGLGVVAAADLLQRRELSARELANACLARIRERDGSHTHEGDAASINAWVRVYGTTRLRRRIAPTRGSRPWRSVPLRRAGRPEGLYAVAGKPLTASSSLLHDVPDRHCDAWARLAAAGMVLLGHLHTHEFAAGGTTDQVGNPHALELSAGGSSGGSAAALASRHDAGGARH
jgi:Asp-tRNAAsn/Glu-tRNAGln amidotransferase A subunit and related amidases